MADTPYIVDHRPLDSNTYDQLQRNPSYAEVQALFKMQVDRTHGWAAAGNADYVYKLVGFELKEGPANLQPQVRDEVGQPLDQRLVLLHWPDAPQLPDDFGGPDYFSNAVAGFTDGGGSVGFGIGAGGVVGGDGGPYAIWVASDPTGEKVQHADCAKKLGWLGGTDHLVVNPLFQITQKGNGTTPPPTTGNDIIVVLNGQPAYRIPVLDLEAEVGDNYLLIPEYGKIDMQPLEGG